MPNKFISQFIDLYGDDLYLNDPIKKIIDINEANSDQEIMSEQITTLSSTNTNNVSIQNPSTTDINRSRSNLEITENKVQKDLDAEDLNQFFEQIKNCQNCELCKTRNKFVFGKGHDKAEIMIIGEAPGADEDRLGLPFVGKAGQLLDKILASIDLDLTKVFITNIVKCRPPNNRDPRENEINKCIGYLNKQIELLDPKIILALGRVAGKTLLNQELSLSKMRGQFHSYQNRPLLVTYHPSALLRNEAWKRPTWDDMKLFKSKLTELLGEY